MTFSAVWPNGPFCPAIILAKRHVRTNYFFGQMSSLRPFRPNNIFGQIEVDYIAFEQRLSTE